MITRRTLTAASLAALAAPALARAKKPIVIAHRGASGERPEHTLMAYRLAIEEGCDFIEPDLVATKDGHLVVRHEDEIAGTTDVASRPEFAARKAERVIDGQKVAGWFTEDFTLAELKTLRARERLPQLRPGSARFDGREPIPTYQEVVDLAKAESKRVGRTIGTYPEMKHPTYFASLGLPLEQRLADALKANGLDSKTAPVFVQCFEVEPLKAVGKLTRARRVMLVGQGPAPVDVTSASGIKAIAAFGGPHRRRRARAGDRAGEGRPRRRPGRPSLDRPRRERLPAAEAEARGDTGRSRRRRGSVQGDLRRRRRRPVQRLPGAGGEGAGRRAPLTSPTRVIPVSRHAKTGTHELQITPRSRSVANGRLKADRPWQPNLP